MTSKNLTLAGALILASSGAFIAGRISAPDAGDSDAITAADGTTLSTRVSSRATGSEEGSASSSRRNRSARDVGSSSTRGAEALAKMEALMRTTDPIERNKAWLDFINSVDPSEFESVVASFRALGMTDARMTEYAMLLSAWAKKDPLQALAYAEANTGNQFARNTILTTWAAADPAGAVRWAQEHHEGDGGNPWMIGVIRGIADSDPTYAAQLLSEMAYSQERGEALGVLVPTMLAQGNDAAKAWAESITDENLKQGAIGRIAEEMAKTDPQGTADWLASNPGQAADRSMDNVVSAWMDQDQDAAISYYKALPQGDLRTNALRGVANSLALNDPRAAADFIDANAGDANDQVYQQFVWHSFGEAPDISATYIAKITDTRQQERMYRRMLDGWLRRDFDSASTWIGNNPLPENVQQRVDQRMQEIQQRQQ